MSAKVILFAAAAAAASALVAPGNATIKCESLYANAPSKPPAPVR